MELPSSASMVLAWAAVASLDAGGAKTFNDECPGLSSIYDTVEVECPYETRSRMDAVLVPALEALDEHDLPKAKLVGFGDA